jgi:hypothetical protein
MAEVSNLTYDPELVLADGSKELWDQVRLLIVEPGGLYFFNKFIIGFPDLTRRAHLPLCCFYEDEDIGNSKLVEFPKSHLKSSCGTVGKELHIFAKLAILGLDLNRRTAIASSTKTNAMRFLRLIMNIVESNTIFQAFLPELLPEFGNEETWNREEITFPRRQKFTDPSIDTLGVGGAATSRHYTDITEDDMLNEESSQSVTAIAKAIELHKYYTSLLVDDTGRYLTNEHAWREHDVNQHVVDSEPETAVFSVGATTGFNQDRSRHVPPYIREMCDAWDDGDTVWPERYGARSLARRREKTGARIYNAVYENNPYDPDVVDFQEGWVRYYEWNVNGDLRIMPKNGAEMEVVPRSALNVVGMLDPALSQKTTAARSSITNVGIDPLMRAFLLEEYAVRKHPFDVLDDTMHLIKKWKPDYMGVESVLFQKVLHDLLVRMAPKHGIFIGTFKEVPVPRGSGKDQRLRAFIGTVASEGRLHIHATHTKFLAEYVRFPLSKTRDLLDAFTGSGTLWTRGEAEEEVAAMEREERLSQTQRDPVTGY